jgi:hypothetical protein
MNALSDAQIDFLAEEIQKRGIDQPGLADNLLDHFCCSVEDKMAQGLGFHEAYHHAYMEICPDGLREIEWATRIVTLQHQYATMKKIVFAVGFVGAFFFATGSFFKSMSWPTANLQMLIGGAVFALAFLPLYFLLKYKADQQLDRAKHPASYVLNLVLVMLLAATVPYKIMHFPGETYVWVASQLLLAFVFLPKVFLSWYRRFAEGNAQAA